MVPLRANLKYIFSARELRVLDGNQPDADGDEPDFYVEAPLPGWFYKNDTWTISESEIFNCILKKKHGSKLN